jgi:hypothetical protein
MKRLRRGLGSAQRRKLSSSQNSISLTFSATTSLLRAAIPGCLGAERRASDVPRRARASY